VRRIDRFVSFLMWLTIAISVLVMAVITTDRSYRSDWPYTVALCSLWVPPALSLAQLDDTPGRQSPWFYRFAILTLLWSAAVGAYGFFLFDVNR
jgi:hypothetical protein